MIKILVINTVGLKFEGITSVIYNYLSNINLEDLQIDFLCHNDVDTKLEERFQKLGSLAFVSKKKESIIMYILELSRILNNAKYDVVHIHGNSGTMFIEVALSHFYKVRKIIVHAHNTRCDYPVINWLLKRPMKWLADELLACSQDAGNWLYGNSEFLVLNNAIDTDRFSYSKGVRNIIRRDLGIGDDEYVVGHSGNFNNQKNHVFLIELFSLLTHICKKAKLMLLSDGPLLPIIKQRVEELGLESKVIFLGRRSDPERYYQGMDIFVFPSKWEGLGLALVEAQAAGLPCIASNAVPREANVTETVQFLDLDPNLWVKRINEDVKSIRDRTKTSLDNIEKIKKNGYDIKLEAKRLEKIYRKPSVKNARLKHKDMF